MGVSLVIAKVAFGYKQEYKAKLEKAMQEVFLLYYKLINAIILTL